LAPLTKLARELGVDGLEPADAVSLLVRESVKRQVQNLTRTEAGKVQIHGWVYHLNKGTLKDLGVTVHPS
jgi:carbonic anhydrase